MAHFAELDESNNVINVVVVADEKTAEIPNTSIDGFRNVKGREVESIGIDFLERVFGHRRWVQTSYNHRMRKQYASVGDTYDAVRDKFIKPAPFASWSLDSNDDWWPPKNPPDGTHIIYDTDNPWAKGLTAIYLWKESEQEWYDASSSFDLPYLNEGPDGH